MFCKNVHINFLYDGRRNESPFYGNKGIKYEE